MKIRPQNRTLEFTGRPSVLELLVSEGIKINHSCEGMGTCGTCMVQVLKGNSLLGDWGEVEKEILQDRKCNRTERLACQIPCVDGLEIEIPEYELGDDG